MLWIAIFVLYSVVVRTFDPFHVPIFAASVLALVAACAAVALGASVTVGVTIMVLSPAVIIVAFETVAYRHEQWPRATATGRLVGDYRMLTGLTMSA